MDAARENMNRQTIKELTPEKIEQAKILIKKLAYKTSRTYLKINPDKEYGGEV